MLILAIFLFALALLFLGFEMLLVLGLPGLIVKEAYFGNLPNIVIGQKIVGGINHSTLLAIPFFILAAEIMAKGRIARDLTQLVKVFLGHRAGGMGHTTVAACVAFGSVSGSAPATVV
jgi:C4-dicarboxylate transporter DctM subunit